MNNKWKTDKWFVSPWNYNEDIVSQYKFAKDIKMHDTTLRDGEQQTGIEFTYDDKVRIAEKLAEAGVHRIEVGMPAVSKQDEKAIRDLAKRNLGVSEIFAFSRCMIDDVKLAVDCGVKGIVVEIPSSEHIIKYAYQWPLEKAIDLSIKATNYAKENGLKTIFFTIDASRADMNWLIKIIKKVAEEGHMDGFTLVDTMGVLTPDAVKYFVTEMKKNFDIPLEAHFHNDFNLAVVNTLTALSLGVEVAHTTVCGIGERSGGAALEDVVVALLTLYGIDVGIKVDKLYDLAKLVVELSGHRMPVNKSVVGDYMFKLESGIPVAWSRKCTGDLFTEVFPLKYDLMGQPEPEIVLGKGSGDESIKIYLEKLEIDVPQDKIRELTFAVKDKSMAKKGLVTIDEFKELVSNLGYV